MLVKVCLNGARRRADHPAVPVTPAELAASAAGAVAAGAGAVHVHPRDEGGAESLDGGPIGDAVAAIRAACGAPVGVSTGAWFLPDPADRLRAIEGWDLSPERIPDFASVNIHEDGSAEIAAALLDRGIGVEAGLWHAEAARSVVDSGLAANCTRLLVEPLQQDVDEALAVADAVLDALGDAAPGVPRLLHGFQAAAWPVLEAAVDRGLDTRIGMEDTPWRRDGALAADNAELVAEAIAIIDPGA